MPTAVGPNTKGEENLVFGYDLGDVSNSYKGAPTLNYTAHQTAVKQTSYTPYSATSNGNWNNNHPNAIRAYNIDGGDITGYVNTGVGDWENTYHAIWEYDPVLDKPVVAMDCTDGNWRAKSFDPNTGQWSSQGWGVGTKYVISWDQWTTHLDKSVNVGLYTKNSSNSSNFWDGLSGNSVTSQNTKTRTWQRVYHVYTASSNWDQTIDYQRIYMYGHYFRNGAGVKVKVANVQLEINQDYASPFTGVTAGTSGRTTRSATQGLLDLTGNSTIDLTNVSFDSNAQMTFDGTSDRATLGTVPLAAGASTYSIEAVFKADSAKTQVIWEQNSSGVTQHQRACMILISNGYGGFNGQSNDYHSAVPYSTGVWYHWIITIDKNASTNPIKIYVNGTLYSQGDSSAGASNLNVGTHGAAVGYKVNSNSEYFDGDIKFVKVYDRVLTAKEIKSNFNAIKGRFNI